MKILVTGANGYIGSYMSNHLSNDTSNTIIPLCRKLPTHFNSWRNKFEVIECDVTQSEELRKKVPKDIDAIIHLAALNDVESLKNPDQALIVNGIGTRNMLEIAKETNCKNFIYFSGLQVYGRELNGTFTVDSPINCDNDYSFTHYVAEGYCKLYSSVHNLNTNVIRLSYSFGCPISQKIDRWTLIPECFCLSAYEKGEIRLKSSGKSKRDFIPLEYVKKSVEHIIKEGKNGFNIYNITSENTFAIIELAKLVQSSAMEILGKEIKLITENNYPKESNEFLAKNNLLGPLKREEVWKSISEEIKKTLKMLAGGNK